MLGIPGIDPQRVSLFGKKFLKLIGQAHTAYDNMMQRHEDRDADPNHNVVISISSDEDESGAEFEDLEDDDFPLSQGEQSQYFQPSVDVDAFNAQCEYLAVLGGRRLTFAVSQTPTLQPSQARPTGRLPSQAREPGRRAVGRGGPRSGSRGAAKGAFKKGSRKGSTGPGRGRGTSQASRRKSGSGKTNHMSGGGNSSKRAEPSGGLGGRGIGMMPT